MKFGSKKYSIGVFAIYFIILIWLVIFKFSIYNVTEMDSIRSINLIPFQGILDGGIRFKEILYNILVFIPMGVYLSAIQKDWKAYRIVLACFGVSLGFEIIQYVFSIGVSDITDLIGNTSGGLVGIIFYRFARRIFKRRTDIIMNTISTILMVLFLLLFLLLMLANRF